MNTEDEALKKVETNKTFYFDINMSSVNVSVSGINENMSLYVKSRTYTDMVYSRENISNGTYFFDSLIPDNYDFMIVNETGVEKYNNYKFIRPNENEYDILVGEV